MAVLAACGGAPPGTGAPAPGAPTATDRILVVAPHPDDELLMAGATLADAAARGVPHEVVVVTNGDLGCGRDGWRRQEETVAALATLGVTEAHVHFLGYPDGHLDALGEAPLPPLPRAARDGTCGVGDHTYGARGAERADLHTALHGEPAPYVAGALEADLAAFLERFAPSVVHLPHGIDTHPDHAATYAFVRRALERADLARLPLLVRHVVHAGPCWPASDAAGACVAPSPALDRTPLPPLPPPLGAYAPDTVVALDAAAAARTRAAIERYVSQLDGPPDSAWLASFARATEAGWAERLARDPRSGALAPEIATTGEVDLAADAPAGAAWRAPVVLRASIPDAGWALLGAGARGEPGAPDAYLLARAAREVTVRRGGRDVLRVALPEPRELEPLALRLWPGPSGHVELELRRDGRYLAGAVDAGGPARGTGLTAGPGVTNATLRPVGVGFDETGPLR